MFLVRTFISFMFFEGCCDMVVKNSFVRNFDTFRSYLDGVLTVENIAGMSIKTNVLKNIC